MAEAAPTAASPMPGSKRFRPPKIDLTRALEKKGPTIQLERDSPVLQFSDDEDDVFEDTLQLSDSDSSGCSSPIGRSGPSIKLLSSDEDPLPDDITKDLAALQELRQSVKTNLRLRPIRSRSNLPKVDIESVISRSPFTTSGSPRSNGGPLSALSPTSSVASSYFTPTSETPHSALFSANSARRHILPSSPLPPVPQTPCSISPKSLYNRLLSSERPLLIDTRPLAAHQAFHLRHSINIAIPSLILKRYRRSGGGLQSLDALKQFATTEQGKAQWDDLMRPGGPWNGDVVVYDDEMDPKDRDNLGITAWAIIPIIAPLLGYGSIDYLAGGISSAGHHPDLETLVVTSDEAEAANSTLDPTSNSSPAPSGTFTGGLRKGAGLFQLDTQTAFHSKKLPEIEPSSSISSNPPSPLPLPRSPMPVMPSTTSSSTSRSLNTSRSQNINVIDASPSPPPSSIGFRRPAPPRRPSAPNLRRLDTKSAERLNTNLPKLSVRTKPMRSATLTVPPTLSLSIQPAQSPSHLQLVYSNHSPPLSARFTPISPSNDPANYLTPYYTPPHTPGTPRPFLPPSPNTARPDLDPPTTEEAYPVFAISTILPNFLFLGPELTDPEHVTALQELGVKRILNIAAECDDDQGLNLKQVFDKYYKIPMRDTVEEDNIATGVREVCEILDDARLHSAPTYVHCKAGKSRSVTAVMAYLIHANHWTLSRAYSFVLERRKGISPNIGFVSELMNFEEQELGGKSVGVQPTSSNVSLPGSGASMADGSAPGGMPENYPLASAANNLRRGGHVRESLPPALGMDGIGLNGGGPMSAGGLMDRVMGDSGQEMEIKDSTGRYRHARRAPVDENTLQPMRRVSKAGLESSSYA
ncbi:hypothetical protein GALMADRAFT_95060 [Galerina marginata CBS 339.88]|uniref:protein-tyrosine-phosphatase n=1 Tax=Galerina marginata (strain CBS 339.88) TaxID=685588 RepID=A0A067TEQ4_GALM3|nr:hypothetical protein GALMADRAFT_95060 [Galerina marginata CBS 339.88]